MKKIICATTEIITCETMFSLICKELSLAATVVTRHSLAFTARQLTLSSSRIPDRAASIEKTSKIKAENIDGKCSSEDNEDAPVDDELENMFHDGPCGIEWNGPTRGGRRPEPTRYGDWERKGRVSDF